MMRFPNNLMVWQNTAGVYFLCLGDELVYVGQSIDCHRRIHDHKRGDKKFDRAYIMPLSKSELLKVESYYIRKYKPRYNRNGVTNLGDFSWPCISKFINVRIRNTDSNKKKIRKEWMACGEVHEDVNKWMARPTGTQGWCDDFYRSEAAWKEANSGADV